MTTPNTRTDQLRALAFNAVTRALPRDRFLLLSERQDVADQVLAALREEIESDGYRAGFTDGERHAAKAQEKETT